MTSTLGCAISWARRASFVPGTRWSSSTPTRRLGPGRSSSSTSAQVVGAVEPLDHDAFDAQVVAPHLLDQLGVVHAFHQDARRARDPGARADDGAAARRGACRRGDARVRQMRGARLLRGSGDEPDRAAVDRERAGVVGEPAQQPGLAAQHDVGAVELHQLAREPGGAVQHAQTGPRRFGRVRGGGALGSVDRTREDAVDGSWALIHRRNGTRATVPIRGNAGRQAGGGVKSAGATTAAAAIGSSPRRCCRLPVTHRLAKPCTNAQPAIPTRSASSSGNSSPAGP